MPIHITHDGLKDAALCILLDADPGKALVDHVEKDLGMLIVWVTAEGLFGGTERVARLPALEFSVAR